MFSPPGNLAAQPVRMADSHVAGPFGHLSSCCRPLCLPAIRRNLLEFKPLRDLYSYSYYSREVLIR